MPFESDTQLSGLSPQIVRGPTPAPVPFGELFETAVQDVTSVGNIYEYGKYAPPAGSIPDPDFDPYTADQIAGYEDFANSFAGVRNADEMALMKRKIDTEREHTRMLSEAGLRGVGATLAAGLLDPLNLIPVAGEVKGAYTLGKLGRVAEGAWNVGRTGLLTSVAGEAISQATQETRIAADSAVGIAAATLLSGVLGGAAGALGNSGAIPRTLNDLVPAAEAETDIYARELADSVGAARLGPNTTMEQETLSDALGVEKLLKFQDPLMRTTQSESIETRRVIQDLAEIPLRFKKNEEGIASPIATETLMKRWHGPLASAIQDMDDAYVKYRLGREKKFGDVARLGVTDMLTRQDQKLGHLEFREAVGRALRRKDRSAIPEAAEAARTFREKVFDPLKDEAIAAGLLPKDVSVDTALSYFTRVYNREKIIARRGEFEKILSDWLADSQQDMIRRVEFSKRPLSAGLSPDDPLRKFLGEPGEAKPIKLDESDEIFARLTANDLKQIATEITDTLLGSNPGRTNYTPVALTRGPLKERTLSIPDKMIEGFLTDDVDQVARLYTRTMAADVELSKRFGRADLQDQIQKIVDDYARLRERTSDEAELKRLNKQMAADIRDIEAVRDRLRGQYALPDNPQGLAVRTFRVARNFNYLRLLGGQTLSALADAGRAVMAHGMTRAFRDGLVPLVTNLNRFKLAADEVKAAGTALDLVLDSRAMSFGEIADEYGRGTRFERGLNAMVSNYSMATLMAPWNAAMKQFAGVVSQTRSLQAIEALAKGTADKKEVTRLAQFGIGKKQALAIAEMFKKHGTKDGGVWWANTGKWEDRGAATAYQAALAKEVDRIVVTPGQDKPLWMSTELGKVIGQFRSFAVSSAQRVLIAGLQERDLAQLNGLLLSTALGMLTYRLKVREEKRSDNPAVWVKEGIDRSGVTGWFFDANNIVEKLSRGNLGVSALLGQPAGTRFASRNVTGALLGPTFDLAQDLATVTGSATSLDWKDADTHAVRKMLPYQNLFYVRRLLDQVDPGAVQPEPF